jgi:N-acetylglucosaminyldiphosphoundecaprenol N-acetyl-beta-D-mannosaminyltransferase
VDKGECLQPLPTQTLLGVPIHALTMDHVIEKCRDAALARERLMIAVVNAAKLVKMRGDAQLRDSVLGSDLILADGMSVVWASRLLGAGLPERVAGIELFEALLALAEREGFSVYFLGARQEVLDLALTGVRERHPKLRLAGSRNGYFRDDEQERVAVEISQAQPDFLFVGISTPKKEIFLDRWASRAEVTVCHGVGGSFDILAGKTPRAPESWQRAGFEWLYRLLQEPRRMWKRYLVTNTVFIALVAGEWARRLFRARS